jgi:uncharacterized membrane protein
MGPLMDYLLLKLIHVLSATVLFGTGAGTAFQMWRAHLTRDVRTIANVSKSVVVADYVFTTPAVVIQPLTGVALAQMVGLDLGASWLIIVYVLYLLTGLCWLPVVWLQIKVRNIATEALRDNTPLPPLYWRYMAWWFALGWPAFAAVIAIFYLMIAKPELW